MVVGTRSYPAKWLVTLAAPAVGSGSSHSCHHWRRQNGLLLEGPGLLEGPRCHLQRLGLRQSLMWLPSLDQSTERRLVFAAAARRGRLEVRWMGLRRWQSRKALVSRRT